MSCLRHDFDRVRDAGLIITASKTSGYYTVRELVEEQGVPKDYRSPMTGESGLMAAVTAEDFRIFRYFMETGAERNFVDAQNKTALDRAIEGMRKETERNAGLAGELPKTMLKSSAMVERLRAEGAKTAEEMKDDPACAHLFFSKTPSGAANAKLAWSPAPGA